MNAQSCFFSSEFKLGVQLLMVKSML